MKTVPTLGSLTLPQKIGQMLCLGWGGDGSRAALNEQARVCVEELHAGGMIVMGRNLHDTAARPLPPIDPVAVRAMIDGLQELAAIPLLIGTDQEGGRVARFGSAPFTRSLSAGTLGLSGDTERAYLAAQTMGRELRNVGVNINFAPVADINSNLRNPVIGDRSFGETVELVVPMVVAQVDGYRESGILSCLKHFPGHGDTAVDSHYALPTLPHSLDRMAERELVPFQAGIAAGAPAIMTAHIVFPALDPTVPATMSPATLTGLLREQLGFRGLIVTDCLEMKAVADHWGTANAAVEAVKAGADLLLVCHTLDRQRETFTALLRAAQSGELSEERIDASVARILSAKIALGPTPSYDPTIFSSTDATASEATTLGESAPVQS